RDRLLARGELCGRGTTVGLLARTLQCLTDNPLSLRQLTQRAAQLLSLRLRLAVAPRVLELPGHLAHRLLRLLLGRLRCLRRALVELALRLSHPPRRALHRLRRHTGAAELLAHP